MLISVHSSLAYYDSSVLVRRRKSSRKVVGPDVPDVPVEFLVPRQQVPPTYLYESRDTRANVLSTGRGGPSTGDVLEDQGPGPKRCMAPRITFYGPGSSSRLVERTQ